MNRRKSTLLEIRLHNKAVSSPKAGEGLKNVLYIQSNCHNIRKLLDIFPQIDKNQPLFAHLCFTIFIKTKTMSLRYFEYNFPLWEVIFNAMQRNEKL